MIAQPAERISAALTLRQVLRRQLLATAGLVVGMIVAIVAGQHLRFIHAVVVVGIAIAALYAPLLVWSGLRLRLVLDEVLAGNTEPPPLPQPAQSELDRLCDALTSMRERERMARLLRAYAGSHNQQVVDAIFHRLPVTGDIAALAALDHFLLDPPESEQEIDASLRHIVFLLLEHEHQDTAPPAPNDAA